MNNKMDIYLDIDNDVPAGASFEQKWYENTIMILVMIRNKRIDSNRSLTIMIEICDGLHWIKHNLNMKLNLAHRKMLEQIFDICIKIIQATITFKNLEYLDIVIDSLRVVSEPYTQKIDINTYS